MEPAVAGTLSGRSRRRQRKPTWKGFAPFDNCLSLRILVNRRLCNILKSFQPVTSKVWPPSEAGGRLRKIECLILYDWLTANGREYLSGKANGLSFTFYREEGDFPWGCVIISLLHSGWQCSGYSNCSSCSKSFQIPVLPINFKRVCIFRLSFLFTSLYYITY